MICSICPRHCGAERGEKLGRGYCHMPSGIVVARAALHYWEEPCISGTEGSGTIFFSGCNLGCIFCQNGKISHDNFGKVITVTELRRIMENLVAEGANNINLVSPNIYAPWIREALEEPLPVPVVWNTSGYDTVETLQSMEGKVQIYLPDLKYSDASLAHKYSHAVDYPEVAKKAILEMVRQVGPVQMRENGLLQSGVVIRHLLLPGALENAKGVMDWVAEQFPKGEVLFSLMSQYTPQEGAEGLLSRRVYAGEYKAAKNYMVDCGLTNGYVQESDSAKKEYTPDFDLTGVL